MSIFRRAKPPPRRAPFFPRTRSRYVPSKTPAGLAPGTGTLTITGHAPTVTRSTNPPVYGLLEDHIFVHDIQTNFIRYLVGTVGMVSASETIHEYIIDPGLVRQEVFGGGRAPGTISPSYGDAKYINVDSQFASLIDTPTDGGKVTCYVGPADGVFPTDFNIEFVAYIDGQPRFTKRDMTLRLRDRSSMLDALVATQGFPYSLSDSKGTRKRPIVYGTPGYLSPILYLPFEVGNVWYLQRNTPATLDRVYDGGVELINEGEAASLQDLFAGAAPSPSSYKWFSDTGNTGADLNNEGTWIRLGSKVRVDLRYYADSGAATISDLAIAAGITGAGTMADGSVDLDVGSRAIEAQTYREVFADVARATISIIGMDRDDELLQRYITPSTEDDYDTGLEFVTDESAIDWEIVAPGGLEKRVHEIKVSAGATTQGQLAGIPDLDAAAAEAISREQWLTEFIGSTSWVVADDPSAERMEIQIEGNYFGGDQDAMLDYVQRLLVLFGSRQIFYWVTIQYTRENSAIQLLDRVRLDGEYGRVISIERRLKDRRIRLGLWRHREFYTVDPAAVALTAIADASTASGGSATSRGTKNVRVPESIVVKCGNHNTPVDATGLVQDIPDFPQSMRFVAISAALTTAQGAGSTLTIDVQVNGASVFTTPITIENGEQYSSEAAAQPVLSTLEIAQGDNFTVHVTQVGDGTAEGLTVTVTGYQ